MTSGVSIFLLSTILLFEVVYAGSANLHWLSDFSEAKCLDGTPAAYYYQPAPKFRDSKKWVIYLAGGGECDTETACKAQLTNALGSSKYFSNSSDAAWWYLASDNCDENEGLCGYNHVLDPYCTQDLHAGQVTEPTDENWHLYFSGHLVLKATLDSLDQLYNLQEATEIILFGVSAGGIGVWMNVDYIAKRYPKARVSAATVAGHYFYATYYSGVNHTDPSSMGDFRSTALPQTYQLYEAFVDETCKESYESKGLSAGACLLSNNSLPYIEVDAFVVQAQTDITVLTGHDCFPDAYKFEAPEQEFMNEFHQNMTVALSPYMSGKAINGSPRRGGFAAACYIHTDFYASHPLVNSMNYFQAFNNYYFKYDSVEAADFQMQDDCGILCNPTCNGV